MHPYITGHRSSRSESCVLTVLFSYLFYASMAYYWRSSFSLNPYFEDCNCNVNKLTPSLDFFDVNFFSPLLSSRNKVPSCNQFQFQLQWRQEWPENEATRSVCVTDSQFWASNHHITLPSNSTSTPRIIAHGSFLLLSVRTCSCKELITCTPNSFHQGLEMHSSLAISEGFLIFFELDHLLFMSVMIRPSEST